MSDATRQTPAAALLRSYLAERDVKCGGCGYNLRGASGVMCPECGVVIPSPPADYLERKRVEAAALKLCCQTCGYVVTGVDAARCPECGAVEMRHFSGGEPPRVRVRKRWPMLALTFMGLGVFVAVGCGLAMVKRGVTGFNGGPVDPGLGLMLALGSVGMGGVWLLLRRQMEKLEPGERKAAAFGIWVLAVVMLIAGSMGIR